MGSTAGWQELGGHQGAQLVGTTGPGPFPPSSGSHRPLRSPAPKQLPSCAHLPSPLVIPAAQLGKKVAVVDYVEPSPRGKQPLTGAVCPAERDGRGQFLVQRVAGPRASHPLLSRVSRECPVSPIICRYFKVPRSYLKTTLNTFIQQGHLGHL